jgi:hypothetical protein
VIVEGRDWLPCKILVLGFQQELQRGAEQRAKWLTALMLQDGHRGVAYVLPYRLPVRPTSRCRLGHVPLTLSEEV